MTPGVLKNPPGVLKTPPGVLKNPPGVLKNPPGVLKNPPGVLWLEMFGPEASSRRRTNPATLVISSRPVWVLLKDPGALLKGPGVLLKGLIGLRG